MESNQHNTEEVPVELEEAIYRKLSEFRKLTNRCRRYWRKLAKESMIISKSKGFTEFEFVDLNDLPEDVLSPSSSNKIPIYQEDDEIYDEILLKFSKHKFPSLYHKFQRCMKKYEILKNELGELKAKLEKLDEG